MTVFLTVLSASVVALALVANATGLGPTTRTVALGLLPVVLLIGLATFVRLVEIGNEDMRLVLAMNRVRHGYLTIAPGLEPYFSTGHHDDQQGLMASLVVAGAVAFLVVWGALFAVNARTARTLRATAPRFPTPAADA